MQSVAQRHLEVIALDLSVRESGQMTRWLEVAVRDSNPFCHRMIHWRLATGLGAALPAWPPFARRALPSPDDENIGRSPRIASILYRGRSQCYVLYGTTHIGRYRVVRNGGSPFTRPAGDAKRAEQRGPVCVAT